MANTRKGAGRTAGAPTSYRVPAASVRGTCGACGGPTWTVRDPKNPGRLVVVDCDPPGQAPRERAAGVGHEHGPRCPQQSLFEGDPTSPAGRIASALAHALSDVDTEYDIEVTIDGDTAKARRGGARA